MLRLGIGALLVLASGCGGGGGGPSDAGPDGAPTRDATPPGDGGGPSDGGGSSDGGGPDDAGGSSDGGGSSDDGGPGDAGADARVPPREAHLVLGEADGLAVFHTEGIGRGEDPDPDVRVPSARVDDVVAIGERLFAGQESTGAIAAYDDAWGLTASATPVGTIPAAGLHAFGMDALAVDAAGTVWANTSPDGILRFAGADGASLPTAATASFNHPFFQIPGIASVPSADRLFLGQASGAGILIFEAVSAATGDRTADAVLDADCASWAMTTIEGRLFASCSASPTAPAATIQIWDGVSSLGAGDPPDVTLTMDVDGTGGAIWDVLVAGDTLFVGSEAGLRVWNDASAISAPRAPDHTVDAGSVAEVAHASDGTVFCLSRSNPRTVTVVRDAATAPDVWTTLTGVERATSILVLE